MIRRGGVAAGGCVVAELPLLSWQDGSPPDLVLGWNDMARRPRSVDVVLHLHGYSPAGRAMNLLLEKLPLSGLDFGDPAEPPGASAARSRPTLTVLPRGRFFGGRTGFGYDFPALTGGGGVAALLEAALDRFAETIGGRRPAVARRVLTAHSGGGAALMGVARHFDPHEIHVFDGLYSHDPALAAWGRRAVARDAARLRAARPAAPSEYLEHHGRVLRVFYIAASGTEAASLAVGDALDAALAEAGPRAPALMPWYRVEPVAIEHFHVARALGWRLLADAAAGVPAISSGAAAADRR